MDNLVICEKEQQVINQMKDLRGNGLSYEKIANQITNSTRKKFPVSWVFKILNHEDINSIVKLVVA